MAGRKYPYHQWARHKATREHPPKGSRRCHNCHEIFTPGSWVFERDIQNNWFRGDDATEWYCATCAPDKRAADRAAQETS